MIVGFMGLGKIMFVLFILCLFDVLGGFVYVGGIDVCEVDVEVLWDSIGFVL